MKKTLKQIQKGILNQIDFENELMDLEDIKYINTNKVKIAYCKKYRLRIGNRYKDINYFSVYDKKTCNHYYINLQNMKVKKNHNEDIELSYQELNLIYNCFNHLYQQEMKYYYLNNMKYLDRLHNNLSFKIEFNKYPNVSKKCRDNMYYYK
jgi:hypothetical protein